MSQMDNHRNLVDFEEEFLCVWVCMWVLCRSLAAEWGRYGMRFNAIAPGPIETKVGIQSVLYH